MITLNQLATQAHDNAVKHGFWETDWSNEHCLMLIITEIAEAVEAHRKGKHADVESYNKAENKQIAFERYIKNTLEDELADTALRIADLAGKLNVDLSREVLAEPQANTFTEKALELVSVLTFRLSSLNAILTFGLNFLFTLAKEEGIDLWFFIEQKMKYNQTRPYLHGKKY